MGLEMRDYKLLVAARDVFAKQGGAKYALCDEDNKVCVMGAINMADHGNAQWNGDEQAPMRVGGLLSASLTGDKDEKYYYNMVVYNNRHDITQDDVLVIFDKAIAEYEEKVNPE